MSVRGPTDFAHFAGDYDTSRRVEPAIASALIASLRALNVRSVAEVGAGTGNYTCALAAAGFGTIAIDREPAMAALGAAKVRTRWVVADAARMPLRDGAADAVACVNLLHHLDDLAAALAEIRRVARAGAALHAVVRENLETLWYRRYFPEIDSVLLPHHPSLGALITATLRAGFEHVRTSAIFYSGRADLTFEAARTRPELLFDPEYRAATTGFRRLAPEAVARGLAMLERELAAGSFARAAAAYDAAHERAGDCVMLEAR